MIALKLYIFRDLHRFSNLVNMGDTSKTIIANRIKYGEIFKDEHFEYRQVELPKSYAYKISSKRLLHEDEWRAFHIRQSHGWTHFMTHPPEPHVLIFRRPLNTNRLTGKAPVNWKPPT